LLILKQPTKQKKNEQRFGILWILEFLILGRSWPAMADHLVEQWAIYPTFVGSSPVTAGAKDQNT
jgi:hypothetical protein